MMQKKFKFLIENFLWGSTILGMTIGFVQLPALSQSLTDATDAPLDNIYHENENLPDDVDVFPRMGKIVGNEQEETNCRISPWNRVVTRFPGNSFLQIDRRQVDSNNESWFHNPDRNCWIHDSRIDLL